MTLLLSPQPGAFGHDGFDQRPLGRGFSDDPSWLITPGMLDAPEIRQRLKQPRRQLDPYSLYISSHIALEGEYVEPSPSPSPSRSVRYASPSDDDNVQNSHLHTSDTSLDIEMPRSKRQVSPESQLLLSEAVGDGFRSQQEPQSNHDAKTSVAAIVIPESGTQIDDNGNDQLPTPTSISRSSTLVDTMDTSTDNYSASLRRTTVTRSKRSASVTRGQKRKDVKSKQTRGRDGKGDWKITKTSSPRRNAHTMVTRSKRQINSDAFVFL